MAKTKILICPYCGAGQPASVRCRGCGGLFEPLSRQATLNAMGPWFIREPDRPFQPGCSYETLVRMVDRGRITKTTIVRGPTTRQLWTIARRVSGVAHLLGYCHACDASVDPGDHACHACGAAFGAYLDRNYLGLPEIRPLPWEADVDEERRRTEGIGGMGGRLSRFASDEELLNPDGSRAGVTAFAAAESAPSAAGDALAEYASTTVTRSLQRRVASQTRTNRLLGGLVVVAVAIAIGTNIGPLMRQLAPSRPEAARQPRPEALDPPAPMSEAEAAPAPSEPASAPTPAPVPGAAAHAAVETAGAAGAAPAGAAPAAELQEASRLIGAAGLADRPIDERIADYERALQLLEAIRAIEPPAALTTLIQDAQAQLERLILKRDWFDKPEE